MTDNLRDRIAALLELLRPVTPTEAADAVIRELGLEREDDYDKFLGRVMAHRYVTEWTTNE